MESTEPRVFLIAKPQVDWREIVSYLNCVGEDAIKWYDRVMNEDEPISIGEVLVEFGGRLCYRSWAPHLNKNVTRVREDSKKYFANILSSKHGSVLEHANYSFVFHNVSRVFTHELVRHRAGTAISQESLRYVRLDHLDFRVPPVLDPIKNQVIDIVERLEDFQITAAKELELDKEGLPFHIKKEVTSALRRLAPLGLSTGMLWTANIRTLRHVIEARTMPGAEEEMIKVFGDVGHIMQKECPFLFQDFHFFHDTGQWVCSFSKV